MDECQPIYEPIGEFWLCAGACGQWKKGMAAAHNGSGYVCCECEQKRLEGLNPVVAAPKGVASRG